MIAVAACCFAAVSAAEDNLATLKEPFRVELPKQVKVFPESLPEGAEPGFKLRGTKGWAWTPEQYMEEIPVLAKCKMNFLMNCYSSMFEPELMPGGFGKNEWWLPLSEAKKNAYAEIVRSCQKHGIAFCFCMNPNINSTRFAGRDPSDVDALWQHYQWMQSLGVKWFSISLDDISQGINAEIQSNVVNEIFRRLREKAPGAQMIFCPTYYWGNGVGDENVNAYNAILAKQLHPDVYVFWTAGTPYNATRRDAESYKKALNHRVILWDNYPVNDRHPTMQLGPVRGRDADLCKVVDGYMANPHCPQNRINRVALLTCADYAYNPKAYNPSRSIGQAIAHLAENDQQRECLAELTAAYPGCLVFGGNLGTNPVRERFQAIAAKPDSRAEADKYISDFEALTKRFSKAFPDQFPDAIATMAADVDWLKAALNEKYKAQNAQ